MVPIEDVRAIANWSVKGLKDDSFEIFLIPPNTKKPELLKMMIHSLILERQRTSRLVQSSGAMSVDPPSAERARSSGAMSVDSLVHVPETNGKRDERCFHY